MIDRDPRPLGAGESTTDLLGAARISGGGRDLGAFELQVAAPVTPGGTPPSSPSGPNSPPPPLKATAARFVPVRAGQAELKLRCPATVACRGVARLTARIVGGNGRKSRRFLGRTRYTVPAGSQKVVKLRLNRTARKALEAAPGRRLGARLAGRGTTERAVQLKQRAKGSG